MKRKDRIACLEADLKAAGVIHLRDAAARLGVSEMTVRRDLASAPESFDYFGGYILAAGDRASAYRLESEADAHAEAKSRACRQAVQVVEADDTLFIDCGTTTPYLVDHLPAGLPVTIVCYAMNVAARAVLRPATGVVMLGGVFHPSSQTFAGEEGLRTLERVGLNKAFLSAGGVHAVQGVSCSNFHEVPVKQAAMARALRSILIVDSSKIDRVKPARFAPVAAFSEIVTESGPVQVA